MVMARIKKRYLPNQLDLFNPLITEPNQSFTPREIIQQFARNELTCKSFDPSDDLSDDTYSEDELLDEVVSFEDEFEARQYINDSYVEKLSKNEKNQSVEAGTEVQGESKEDSGSGEE